MRCGVVRTASDSKMVEILRRDWLLTRPPRRTDSCAYSLLSPVLPSSLLSTSCSSSYTCPDPLLAPIRPLSQACIISLSCSTTSKCASRLYPPHRFILTDLLDSHPWHHVVIGMWHKYPNPHCSHVVTIDVVDRSVDPNTGIIRTERILGCKQKTPTWIVKVRCRQGPCLSEAHTDFCVL